jgi:endonuclease/exonuclease/phosphatase family metal-dependent hydrolase
MISGNDRRRRRLVVRAAVLAGLLASFSCTNSNPNYTLEACPMNGKPRNSASARQPTDLRVMTLNMWGIRFVSADIDARFDALADRLNADDGIDVVGLQETWADAPRKRLLEKVAPRFPHQADFQAAHGRSGLVVLSRHPFATAPRFIGFPRTGKWWKPWTGEWLGGKGIGAVQIEAGGGRLWFFVTHLHACYTDTLTACENGDEYGQYRSHQLEVLRGAVNDIAGAEPALIVGDFNFTMRSPLFTALTTNGVYPPDLHDPAWRRVEEPEAPARRIDYIWMRPGQDGSWHTVEQARTEFTEPVPSSNGKRVPLSDHCAVAATLRRG